MYIRSSPSRATLETITTTIVDIIIYMLYIHIGHHQAGRHWRLLLYPRLWDGGGIQKEGQRGAQGLFLFVFLLVKKNDKKEHKVVEGQNIKLSNHFPISSIVGPQRSSESRIMRNTW